MKQDKIFKAGTHASNAYLLGISLSTAQKKGKALCALWISQLDQSADHANSQGRHADSQGIHAEGMGEDLNPRGTVYSKEPTLLQNKDAQAFNALFQSNAQMDEDSRRLATILLHDAIQFSLRYIQNPDISDTQKATLCAKLISVIANSKGKG